MGGAFERSCDRLIGTDSRFGRMPGLALDVALPLGILYLVSDGAQRPSTRQAEPEGV